MSRRAPASDGMNGFYTVWVSWEERELRMESEWRDMPVISSAGAGEASEITFYNIYPQI
jgi:hypothetical protein